MTDKLRQAAQQALEALEQLQGGCTDSDDGTVEAITVWCPEVIKELREALAEPAGEPGYQSTQLAEMILSDCGHSSDFAPLLERVAKRIDAHVEQRLAALRECMEAKKPAEVQEPVAIVKWQTGCKVVHLIGDAQVGALLCTHPSPQQAAPAGAAQSDQFAEAMIDQFERHFDTGWDDPLLRNERLAWIAAWSARGAANALHIELRNLSSAVAHGDQSVLLAFSSCRAASAFKAAALAAQKGGA